jgi:hypothetical protein
MREQSVRTQRHITLWKDVVAALGQFKELNDPKGDVDGSVEAIWSFSKLSTEEIQINISAKVLEQLLKLTLC